MEAKDKKDINFYRNTVMGIGLVIAGAFCLCIINHKTNFAVGLAMSVGVGGIFALIGKALQKRTRFKE